MPHVYETDGAAIYTKSFATIRAEADLARFSSDEEPVVVRMILLEGQREMPVHDGLVAGVSDPLLRIAACTGAPACEAAHADTRALAAALAPHLAAEATLHVSGCAKGCAHPDRAAITLVATSDGFDVIRNGTVRDMPALRGVSGVDILADPRPVLERR